MTLIIEIRCPEGVVVGSDRIATLGALGKPTVQQEVQKLEIIEDRVIVGVSGFIGLGQRIIGSVEETWNDKISKDEILVARSRMRDSLWKVIGPELDSAGMASRLVGNQVAGLSAVCHTLIALPVKKSPVLLQFDQQCASEEATADLTFVSIGSGRTIADPFLAFLKRVLWNNKNPSSLGEGVFATLWTLKHVISTHAGGFCFQEVSMVGTIMGKWLLAIPSGCASATSSLISRPTS